VWTVEHDVCDHASPHGHSHASLGEAPPLTPHGAAMSRRAVLQGAAGAGLLMAPVLGDTTAAAAAGGSRATARGASRFSAISRRTTLVHADLHNHSLLSDGDGDPALAFESMRAAGLDVAALTDHSTFSDNVLGQILTDMLPPEYTQVAGLTQTGWENTKGWADAANLDGRFTAIRGFEWSEPALGHVNVWFSEHYVDVLQAGVMAPFYEWLRRVPGLVLDGGADGIAGFNHPGREQGRFQEFTFDPAARDQMVSLEMFNRRDDYLFEGWADGMSSPLTTCLNAGWRTGISGVTDEHGTDWGQPEGKGRTGLWVARHDRAGVKAAMKARRFFATRTSGLRVDAVASTRRSSARMGSVLRLPNRPKDLRITLDVARDASWRGRRLVAQVLRPGIEAPVVVRERGFRVGEPFQFVVPRISLDDGDWMLIRIADPTEANATPGPEGHPCNKLGIAYTSPWWFEPRAAR
jgi:hypothetical protein